MDSILRSFYLFIMYIINFLGKKFGGFGNVVYLCGVVYDECQLTYNTIYL